jgi:hypothetical protein
MGSTESLPGLEQPEGGKVFKSTFAKELEEGREPTEPEETARRRRPKAEVRVAEAAGVQKEYSRLREENASLRLEIMKIQLEDKKYRDLQQEVDQLSWQLRKVAMPCHCWSLPSSRWSSPAGCMKRPHSS